MFNAVTTSIKALLVYTVVTGFIYTLFITIISQTLFREKANGSLIMKDNKVIGSKIIGQKFDDEKYFWSRPSAIDYNPMPSGGSNHGPTSKILKKQVYERRFIFTKKNLLSETATIPTEMLFASASGVDPHISPGAAYLQIERICRSRNFSATQKKKLINLVIDKTELPQLGFLGEKRINVLLLNIELDNIK